VNTLTKFEAHQPIVISKKVQKLFKTKGNKKKMLTSLSGDFIRFFLNSTHAITLEEAAEKFCGEAATFSKIKTKVRRLYDISNVFVALGLIEKTIMDRRKPAFTWIGLKGYLEV